MPPFLNGAGAIKEKEITMIGLSLSLCVRDILSGNVDINDVEKIIAGTMMRDVKSWNTVITGYMGTYWQNYDPTDVYLLLNQLVIVQHRLDNPDKFPMIYSGHWVNSENDIIWSDAL